MMIKQLLVRCAGARHPGVYVSAFVEVAATPYKHRCSVDCCCAVTLRYIGLRVVSAGAQPGVFLPVWLRRSRTSTDVMLSAAVLLMMMSHGQAS
jgi:hypothetical protein